MPCIADGQNVPSYSDYIWVTTYADWGEALRPSSLTNWRILISVNHHEKYYQTKDLMGGKYICKFWSSLSEMQL